MPTPYWKILASNFRTSIVQCERSPPLHSSKRFTAEYANTYWRNYYIGLGGKGWDTMATKKKYENKMVFVQCALDAAAKKDFEKRYAADHTELFREYAILVGTGHKVSHVWDDENQCYIASAMGREEDHQNYNKCLSARSDDLYEAMCLLAYKHHVLYKSGSWDGKDESRSWG